MNEELLTYGPEDEPEIDESVDVEDLPDPNGDPADIDWDDDDAAEEAIAAADY